MIDGAAMPSPRALSVALADVGDDAGRNAQGARVIDRVAVKRTLEIEWAYLSAAALARLMAAVAPPFFTVRYPDPMTGDMRETSFYAREKRAELFRADGDAPAWASVFMKWEEK